MTISGIEPVKEKPVNRKESAGFEVKVGKTDLIKRIPGISKNDIAESVFLFIVETHGVSLFLKSKKLFTLPYNIIRGYNMKTKQVQIGIGRRCEYGEGELRLSSSKAEEIFTLLTGRPKS